MIQKIDVINKRALYDMQITKEELEAKKTFGKEIKIQSNVENHLIECLAEKINEIIEYINN